MKVGDFHLTYCSNIHAGEEWASVDAALATSLPDIRQQLQHEGPFAIGLRLSAAAARSLETPDTLAAFRAFLREGAYYVPTINGFPYGAFHGTRVKERVYEPDWRNPLRVDYSNRLSRLLAIFAADAGLDRVSISTVPGAFRQTATTQNDRATIAAGILDHAAYLKRLADETGVTITLAIEPEPACVIETVDEAIAFFRDYLFDPQHIARASAATATTLTTADVARHIGMCLDACHMAVEFEDPARAIDALRAEGIAIAKVQLSSALRLQRGPDTLSPADVFGRFADDTYLHQVVIADERGLTRYTDLPDALAADTAATACAGEWRVHFHVPIFLASMGSFDTTQSYLATLLGVLQREAISTCLEVETYTWDVLPPEYRTTDVCTAIARELRWVRDQLAH